MTHTASAPADYVHEVEDIEKQHEGPISLVDLAHYDNLTTRFNNALAKREETVSLGQKPKLKWTRVDQLWIDVSYQRTMRLDHVLNIALEFSWEKFQALSVMRRKGSNRLIVTDGQHKAIAAFLNRIEEVPCLIYDSTGVTDEAEQFYGINNDRRAVPLVVKHRNAVLLGHRDSLELQDLVDRSGLILTEGRPVKASEYNNLSALRLAYRKTGEEFTLKAVDLIRRAWPEEPVNGAILMGLAVFIVLYNRAVQYNEDYLLRTLKYYPSQSAIMEGIDARKRATGIVRENLIANDLLETYNNVNRLSTSSRLRRGPIANILARRQTTPAQLSQAAGLDNSDDGSVQPPPSRRRKPVDSETGRLV